MRRGIDSESMFDSPSGPRYRFCLRTASCRLLPPSREPSVRAAIHLIHESGSEDPSGKQRIVLRSGLPSFRVCDVGIGI